MVILTKLFRKVKEGVTVAVVALILVVGALVLGQIVIEIIALVANA